MTELISYEERILNLLTINSNVEVYFYNTNILYGS